MSRFYHEFEGSSLDDPNVETDIDKIGAGPESPGPFFLF